MDPLVAAAISTRCQQHLRLRVSGVVQGVGFRPQVFRVAKQLQLTGWVCNDSHGVTIDIQGRRVCEFIPHLKQSLPPLARLDKIEQEALLFDSTLIDFHILPSRLMGATTAKIAPDVAVCDECLAELFDPASRFYHYPFLNCTHCGPRYSIIQTLPYDRANTSMAAFQLCDACRADYNDPLNRRYHAQPIACQTCGPQLSHSITEIAQAIRAGKIVALKGLGGYQLICDARNATAVQTLRQRKQRPDKPFAVMALNTASAARWVTCPDPSVDILTGRARPIVLLPKLLKDSLPGVAPHLSQLGIMLPSTPLHYLLFQALLECPNQTDWLTVANDLVLVVTSGNIHGAPLVHDDTEATQELTKIADLVVSYNREIVSRVDDSVVTLVANKPTLVRRARGFVPEPVELPHEIPSTLALGGLLKNTICITRGKEAFLSQHIGDLNQPQTIRFYRDTITHLLTLLNVQPEKIVHDRHPDFYSSRIAAEFQQPATAIQHHHAHIAAVAAEHHIRQPAIALALDGFGLGEDGMAWGGELFYYHADQCRRLGHLLPLPQPGGDVAVQQPWRMASSVLLKLGLSAEITRRFGHQATAPQLTQLLTQSVACPPTSSCGRWFDAAAGVLGVCDQISFDAQAAMYLESLVTDVQILEQGWQIQNNILDLLPTFHYLLDCDPITGANVFHGTLIAALVDWVRQNAQRQHVDTILLSGGCMLNGVLTHGLLTQLQAAGLRVYWPQRVPSNDGGLSLGQAWAAAQLMEN